MIRTLTTLILCALTTAAQAAPITCIPATEISPGTPGAGLLVRSYTTSGICAAWLCPGKSSPDWIGIPWGAGQPGDAQAAIDAYKLSPHTATAQGLAAKYLTLPATDPRVIAAAAPCLARFAK